MSGGKTRPIACPWTFAQYVDGSSPSPSPSSAASKWTLLSTISVHGTDLLQAICTAGFLWDVPYIFSNRMLLISTAELCNKINKFFLKIFDRCGKEIKWLDIYIYTHMICAMFMITIILVDNYRVSCTLRRYVFEDNVSSKPFSTLFTWD